MSFNPCYDWVFQEKALTGMEYLNRFKCDSQGRLFGGKGELQRVSTGFGLDMCILQHDTFATGWYEAEAFFLLSIADGRC